ncbi:MAG: nucleotidyltransferase [Sporolactobacillus sp.]
MVGLQKYFNDFHNTIKLDDDDNQILRDSREEVLNVIKENIDSDAPSHEIFHQGSYAMKTGINAVSGGDFDIDIGFIFDARRDDYSDPVQLKKLIRDALLNEYDDVKIKNPCVTVNYENAEKQVHVDLAIYINDNNSLFLARGKENSAPENKIWEEADPKELKNKVLTKYKDHEKEQFRRTIRYLKRWKDIKFDGDVHRPNGIGITVAGLSYFYPKIDNDFLTGDETPRDIDSLIEFIQNMINNFSDSINIDSDGNIVNNYRLKVNLPVKPFTDIYEKVSDNQMNKFKEKLDKLLEDLQSANGETDISVATGLLRSEFGDDFPVKETDLNNNFVRTTHSAIVNDYPSA